MTLHFRPSLESLDGRDLPNATMVAAPEANAPAEEAVTPQTLEGMIRERDMLLGICNSLQTQNAELTRYVETANAQLQQLGQNIINIGALIIAESNRPNPDQNRLRELGEQLEWARCEEAGLREGRDRATEMIANNVRAQNDLMARITSLNTVIRLLSQPTTVSVADHANGTAAV